MAEKIPFTMPTKNGPLTVMADRVMTMHYPGNITVHAALIDPNDTPEKKEKYFYGPLRKVCHEIMRKKLINGDVE